MTEKIAKNTLFLTMASIGQKAIAFVYFLIVARIIKPENTGYYFFAVSMITVFSVVGDFGITPVLIREMAKQTSQKAQYLRRALAIKLPFISLSVVLVLLYVFIGSNEKIVEGLILVAILVLVLDSLSLLFYGALRAKQKLQYESFGMFGGMVLTAGVGGFVLLTSQSLYGLVIALIAGSTFNLLLSGSRVIQTFGPGALLPKADKEFAHVLLKTALPFALAAIFVKVYSYVDSIIIKEVLTPTDLGLYAIAYKFTYAFQFLPLAFIAALYPALSEQIYRNREEALKTFHKAMWYMMLLVTPIVLGLYVIADEVILLAGEEYALAIPVFQMLIFVLFPIFLDFPIGSLLNAANRQTTKTTILGITMVVNIGLNLLFVPKFGIMGAAYAALISFSFLFILGVYFVPKVLPKIPIIHMGKMIGKILVSGIVMYFIVSFLKPIVGWIASVPIGALVYVGMLLITRSVHKEDIVSFKKIMQSYGKK